MRKQQARESVAGNPAAGSVSKNKAIDDKDLEYLDIPAFLRRQAD
jgi:hypothetical protein